MDSNQRKIISTINLLGDKVISSNIPLTETYTQALLDAVMHQLVYDNADIEKIKSFIDSIGGNMAELAESGNRILYAKMIHHLSSFLELWYLREDKFESALTSYKEEITQLKSLIDELANDNKIYEEIVDRFNNDMLDSKYISECTYKHLAVIKKRNEVGLFKKVANAVYETNIKRIQKQRKITVAFFAKNSAEWGYDLLYNTLLADPEFEVYIAVAPAYIGTTKTIQETYNNCLEYFKNRSFNVIDIYCARQNRYRSWKEMGNPDIIIHLYPHLAAFVETANIVNMPLSTLHVYIPYGIMTYGDPEHQFNQLNHMLYWKIFCENEMMKNMAKKYSDIGDLNVVVSGYTVMDTLYSSGEIDESAIWKIAETAEKANVKKIIYAPHWSIGNSVTGFGNFDKIYKDIYAYAKNTQQTISWVFRPHPALCFGCISNGLFKDEEEYAQYLALWDELPNAHVIVDGNYFDIFITSDAMILDSVSFMSEYLCTSKPILFLTRNSQTFNDYGKLVREVLYKADGGYFPAIVNFIDNVVIAGDDPMKEIRQEFFDEQLNYINKNGKLATDFIYEYLKQRLRS